MKQTNNKKLEIHRIIIFIIIIFICIYVFGCVNNIVRKTNSNKFALSYEDNDQGYINPAGFGKAIPKKVNNYIVIENPTLIYLKNEDNPDVIYVSALSTMYYKDNNESIMLMIIDIGEERGRNEGTSLKRVEREFLHKGNRAYYGKAIDLHSYEIIVKGRIRVNIFGRNKEDVEYLLDEIDFQVLEELIIVK